MKISFNASVNNCPEFGGAKVAFIGKKSMETVFTSGEIEAPVNEKDALHAVKSVATTASKRLIFMLILIVQYRIP